MNFIEVTKKIAYQAGDLLREGFGSHHKIKAKVGAQNLVTEYDHASQNLIIGELKKNFPSHHFLAEEDDVKTSFNEEYIWIIDPLDGTVNFAHNIPFFAVSIALAKNREIIAGVVYNPMLDELFWAEKGSGAYLNEKPISVTKTTSPDRIILATGFPYDVRENPLQCIETFAHIVRKGIPIRRMGVAALDLAYVAAGRFDGFWEVRLHPWDMAAGKLIVEEAGGRVTHYDGSDHQIFDYLPLIASNGHLHETMISYLYEEFE